MQQAPLPSIEEIEEEKLFSLYESLSLSPTLKPTLLFRHTQQDNISSNHQERPEPSLTAPKPGRHRRNSADQDKNVNRGHWLLQENKKYHWFLEIHYKHFVNRHMRRMDKIFKTMETFIGTRQAEQCRSHHQKMEKKYHSFITIIINLRMQHYGSQDVQPLQEDIQSHGHVLTEELATIAMLNAEESMPSIPIPAIEVKQRRKSVTVRCQQQAIDTLLDPPEVYQEQKQLGQVHDIVEVHEGNEIHEEADVHDTHYLHMNMLEQSNLHIGELMLYHQKEENSCFFNFH